MGILKHNGLPGLLFRLVIGGVAAFLLSGCSLTSGYRSFGDATIHGEDEPPAVQFKRTLGEKWHGIYYLGVKVGWAEITRRIRRGPDGDIYQFQWSENMHLQIYGKANVVKISGEKEFRGRPPYDLLRGSFQEIAGRYTRELEIVKVPGGYKAMGKKDGETITGPLIDHQYTLEDELSLELWAQTNPKMGDTVPFRYLSDDMLETRESFVFIQGVDRKFVNEKNYSFYEMMEYHNDYDDYDDYDLSAFNYREDGVLEQTTRGCYSISESESREGALKMGPPVDLYVRAMAPVDRKIGKPDEIRRVRLSLEGLDFDLLGDAPGQVVENDVEQNRVEVVMDPLESPGVRATRMEIERFSESIGAIPVDHPGIVALAKRAVGDEVNRGARVALLAKFVDEYIEDEYVFSSDLFDLIEDKKGDCTEHALLFTALARSLEIPCREVDGLVYLGDWCKGFGMHAWNEVVIDGYWTPVDASVGASPIDPFYIRFPENEYKKSRIITSIPGLKINILKVDKKS